MRSFNPAWHREHGAAGRIMCAGFSWPTLLLFDLVFIGPHRKKQSAMCSGRSGGSGGQMEPCEEKP